MTHIFERDDDVVFARWLCEQLSTRTRPLVFSEGGYWAYSPESGAWLPFPRVEVKRSAMAISGMKLFAGTKKVTQDDGTVVDEVKTKTLNISNGRLNGLCELTENMMEEESHFAGLQHGIAFLNGYVTVDETGVKLSRNSPDWRCRTALPFAHKTTSAPASVYAPKWSAFMDDITRDDSDKEEKQKFLQEFIGVALLGGSVFYEKAALLVGDGSNGKSVFLDVVQSVFPTRNIASIPPQQLSDEYYRARLDGVVLNVVSELPKRDIVDSPALNGVISGDLITARRPRENPFDFRPRAGHIFAVNPPLPTVGDLSGGFWRRFVIVSFNRDFKVDPRVREKEGLVAELKAEAQGIVRWALEGAARVKKQGRYTLPPSSALFLAAWRTESDQVALFVKERTTKVEEQAQMFSDEDLYRIYRKWAEQTGHRLQLSLSKFGQRLTLLGYKTISESGLSLRALKSSVDVAPSRQWAMTGVRPVQSPLEFDGTERYEESDR